MQNETWLKIWCPTCKAVNWTCLGDMTDLTLPDVEGFCCHKCSGKFMLDPDYDSDEINEDIYYVAGEPAPRGYYLEEKK